jgi:16S rRNA (cytosine1407-C5)-methyltransferase
MTKQLPHDFQQLLESLLGAKSTRFTSLIDIRPFPTFRFNPLKHTIEFQRRLLKRQGFSFEDIEGLAQVARVLDREHSIGRSLSHFAGHLYIQDLGSMLPVVVLDPKPGERVLDMCAAPGSKTTHLAAVMGNRGLIVANDVSVKRLRSLMFNLRRMGVQNTAVCKGFGEQYGNLHFEAFQRVLVDPPCSALGTLQKSPEVLSWWTPARSRKLAGIQSRLLESGLKALKPGGILTYSTCTITPEENEGVIDLALREFPVELEQINIPGIKTRPGLTRYGLQQYDSQLAKSIRLYPWDNQSEAFFVARLRKTESFGKSVIRADRNWSQFISVLDEAVDPHLNSLTDYFGLPSSIFTENHLSLQNDLYCSSLEFREFPHSHLLVKAGLPIAHLRGDKTMITTEGAHLFGQHATKRVVDLPDLEALEGYVNREPVASPIGDHFQVLVRYEDAAIGHGISQGSRLLSRFPRTGWRFDLKGRSRPSRQRGG